MSRTCFVTYLFLIMILLVLRFRRFPGSPIPGEPGGSRGGRNGGSGWGNKFYQLPVSRRDMLHIFRGQFLRIMRIKVFADILIRWYMSVPVTHFLNPKYF